MYLGHAGERRRSGCKDAHLIPNASQRYVQHVYRPYPSIVHSGDDFFTVSKLGTNFVAACPRLLVNSFNVDLCAVKIAFTFVIHRTISGFISQFCPSNSFHSK